MHAKSLRSAAITRSTPADASESRDRHVSADLAVVVIRRAHKLCAGRPPRVEADITPYALDSGTIDLRLNLLGWAPFCLTKAAIKLHTLLEPRGAIPTLTPILTNNTVLPPLTICALYKSRW